MDVPSQLLELQFNDVAWFSHDTPHLGFYRPKDIDYGLNCFASETVG